MPSTYEDAGLLAAAALEWAFAQLSGDDRLTSLARGATTTPLHVVARETLRLVDEQLAAPAHLVALGDGPLDKAPSTAQLRRVRAALEFSYARALDVALADPTTTVEAIEPHGYFEPELRADAVRTLAGLIGLLHDAATRLTPLERLADATSGRTAAGISNPLHAKWLLDQEQELARFAAEVRAIEARAREIALSLSFDAVTRRASPHPPLIGLSRREQQRQLLADALLLHQRSGLSEAEIGAIWHDNPPDRAEAKRVGGKVLARARKARSAS